MAHDKAAKPDPLHTVYVSLLDEGTVVFRPSPAQLLSDGLARLIEPPGYDPEDENWQFKPGAIVRIEWRRLQNVEGWVAVEN